ncbi:MAG: ABC transporter permease [Lachnospiraceae bacterium]|nr:ABC transporter permease [Lachnospiraceae bacterium]
MKYVIKKAGTMAITLFVVCFLIFGAFDIIPGDPALSKLGTQATESSLAALRQQMGLNRPFFVRFADWLLHAVIGDYGTSYSYNMPVSDMILDKVPITITLTLMAFVLIVLISIPLAIYSALHENGRVDRTLVIINQIMMAIPPFFSGMLITFVFGITLRLFVPGGFVSYKVSVLRFLGYMFFPAAAIALPKIAMTVKLFRKSILQEKSKDYVRTAFSKGNTSRGVLYGHVMKNALIPVITFLGMVLTDMIAGSIIVEQVFNIPGLGRILMTSISNRDYPVVEAIVLSIAVLVLVVNFLVDVLYHVIDPRMRME